jgi:hypothetical protein
MTLSCDRRPALQRPLLWALLWTLPGVLLAPALAGAGAPAADEPCAAFTWDVAHVRALFASAAQSIGAGRDPASAPLLAADRLYQLQLAPQLQVAMLLPPGKKAQLADTYSGLARLQLARPGSYRVSIDQGAWIDVVEDGRMIDSSDFQGRPGCSAPHKIVQYLLPAAHELLLQISGAAAPQLRLAITAVD